MPYIGKSPSVGVRNRFVYQATAGQTTFSGSDSDAKTLTYQDSLYLDVYQNGVLLKPGTDYTALRDAPADSAISSASDIAALKAAWDTSVLGDSPYA